MPFELIQKVLSKSAHKAPVPIRRTCSVLAIITHYKYDKWLAQSIESLLAQTRPPNAVVVVDDASPQPPIDIVRRYPQVTLMVADQNRGPYSILQAIYDRAQYDVFMMQDADDWSTPDRLELLLEAAEAQRADMVGCQISSVWDGVAPEPERFLTEDALASVIANPMGHPIYLNSSILHRDLVKRVGGLSTGLRLSGDTEFAQRAVFAGRIINIAERCYHRRVHPHSLTRAEATGINSRARAKIFAAMEEPARLNVSRVLAGEPPDLRPLLVGEPARLGHVAGPPLVERRVGTTAKRMTGVQPRCYTGAQLIDLDHQAIMYTPDTPLLDPRHAPRQSATVDIHTIREQVRLLEARKAFVEAARCWQTFLEQHPEDAEAANELGDVFIRMERFEDGLRWFERALKIRPGLKTAKINAGIALRHLSRCEEAAAIFREVLASTPDEATACWNLGLALRALQRHDEALDWLRKASDLRPGDVESARELGDVLTALKRSEEAIAAYQHAVALQPDGIPVLLSFGERLQEARRFEEAAVAFRKVVDLDPNHCNGWLSLGAALLGLHQYAESLSAFRRALALVL
jgi:cytochrome c-type biogenesis protein CcmH/NrfG/GT2 family glycosyltransferase